MVYMKPEELPKKVERKSSPLELVCYGSSDSQILLLQTSWLKFIKENRKIA